MSLGDGDGVPKPRRGMACGAVALVVLLTVIDACDASATRPTTSSGPGSATSTVPSQPASDGTAWLLSVCQQNQARLVGLGATLLAASAITAQQAAQELSAANMDPLPWSTLPPRDRVGACTYAHLPLRGGDGPHYYFVDGSGHSSLRPPPSDQLPAPPLSPTPAPTSSIAATPAITAGLEDLGLIGMWSHHGFTLTINTDGSGLATWRTYETCSSNPTPPCDQISGNEIIDGGHASFTIRALPQSSVAIATILSSTDHSTLGAPGTVQVTPVLGRSGPGREIVFPILPDPNFILCDATAGVTGDCGA